MGNGLGSEEQEVRGPALAIASPPEWAQLSVCFFFPNSHLASSLAYLIVRHGSHSVTF